MMNRTHDDYEKEFKEFKQQKFIDYVKRLDFIKVTDIFKKEDKIHQEPREHVKEEFLINNKREMEQLKFRDLYMDEVYKNIDQYKIDALKKISMEKFDEVQVGCDPEVTSKKRKREKLYRFHSSLLKFYQMLSTRNVVISLVVLSYFIVYILPQLCYAAAAFDRHYFGYFHDREPIYAKTTANQKYYAEHNIPYVTSADINKEYELIRRNRSKGLPAHYEINHKQHYTFTNGVKKIYRNLPTLPIQGLRRHLEGEAEASTEGQATDDKNQTVLQGGAPPAEEGAAVKKKQFEALFPDPFMTKDQIQNGGFIVYFLGK